MGAGGVGDLHHHVDRGVAPVRDGKAGWQNDGSYLTPEGERLHEAYAGLQWRLQGAGQPLRYQLNVANALWGQQGYPLNQDFLELTRKHYGAGLRQVDFAGATEQARRAINACRPKYCVGSSSTPYNFRVAADSLLISTASPAEVCILKASS